MKGPKKQKPVRRTQAQSRFLFEELEPRVLLSADLPLSLADDLHLADDSFTQPSLHEVAALNTDRQVSDSTADIRHELIFVDSNTPDYQQLLDDILEHDNETRRSEVVLLDNEANGIQQITQVLIGREGLDAVHIISHGSAGSVDLGNGELNFDSLFANVESIRAWANAFNENGDLLIYGCELAANDEGRSLVDALGRLTGADVAASDNLTGHASTGGDWKLEYTNGTIDSGIIVSAETQRAWTESLEAVTSAIETEYARVPLAFEQNVGQTGDAVDFIGRGSGYNVFLTEGDAVIQLDNGNTSDVLRLDLVNANTDTPATGLQALPGFSNYLLGNNPDDWHTNVVNYANVSYSDIYAGIDVHYYGNQQRLEYDFVVEAGADTSLIRIDLTGASETRIDDNGDLLVVLSESETEIRFQAPYSYQDTDSGRQAVDSRYIIHADGTVGFELGDYDTSKTLVIDPVLDYGTFFGSSAADNALDITVDGAGNAYITGYTVGTDFPTPGVPKATTDADVFVTKLSADGTTQLYTTFLGGSGDEYGYGIGIDATGNAYVTGSTNSADLPTVNAYQNSLGGSKDAFLVKLDSTGSSVLYSSYFGGATGAALESGYGIDLDASGFAYITGTTDASDLPTKNAMDSTLEGASDAYIAKFDTSLTGAASLIYSTYIGGDGIESGQGIVVDAVGNAHITGSTGSTNLAMVNAYDATANGGNDAYVVKLNSSGNAIAYSTYLGGSLADNARGIDIDAGGMIYITGNTASADFSTTSGAYNQIYNGGATDIFVARIDPTLSGAGSLLYSTYLGGSNADDGYEVAVDSAGLAIVTGDTTSSDLPVTSDALDSDLGSVYDGFVAAVDVDGASVAYLTYLGGNFLDRGNAVAVDGTDNIYIAGIELNSAGFDGIPSPNNIGPGGSDDGFVVKLSSVVANQSPVNSVPGTQATNQDTALVFSTGNSNLISVSDADAGNALLEVTLTATNGTATLNSGAGILNAVGGEFLLNSDPTGTQVTPLENPQNIAVASDGSYVAVWSGQGPGDTDGVFARRFDADGTPLTAVFQVNTYVTSTQTLPVISMNSSGDFIIAWASMGQDGDNDGIFAQRFDSLGNAIGSEIAINDYTIGIQTAPAIGLDDGGGFVVTWDGAGATDATGVWARRFDNTGTAAGSSFRVNSFTSVEQEQPSIAMDAAGNFVITWASRTQDAGMHYGVFGQRYDSAGNTVGGEFQINTYFMNHQQRPSIAMDATGNFVVVWDSFSQEGAHTGVYGQLFDNAGNAVGSEFHINTYTTSNQVNAAVAMNSAGFVVTWTSIGQDGDQTGIYLQQYDAAGNTIGGEIRVNSTTTGEQRDASVAINEQGKVVVMWSGNGPGDADGIFAQRFETPTPLTFTTGDGAADANMTFTGTITDINAALDGLTFTPTAAFNGVASLQIATDDRGNSGSGGALKDNDTILINVGTGTNIPTDIGLSNSAVAENLNTAGGYSVGTLSTTDLDALDTFTYTIVGGTDAASFSIGGAGSDELILDDGVLNYEVQNSYQVIVRATDSSSNTHDELLTVTVNNEAGNISGVAYVDEGVTNIGAGKTISMVINGTLVESVVTGAGGVYSFTKEAGEGDAVALFIDNDATYQGTTVTVSDGSDLSGVQILADHIVIRNDNGGVTSNADLANALGGSPDLDIHYAVVGGTLIANGLGEEVLIPAGHTYTPDGNVSASNIKIVGTVNGGANTFIIAGDWDSTAGTWNADTSTVNLTGTGILLQNTSATPWNHGFNNLSVAAAGQTTTMSSVVWTNQLTTGTGILTDAASSHALYLQGTGNVFIDGGGTLDFDALHYRVNNATQNVVSRDYTGVSELYFNAVGGLSGSGIYEMQGDVIANDVHIMINNDGNPGDVRNAVLNTNNFSFTASNLYVGVNGQTDEYAIFNAGSSIIDINGDVVVYATDANGTSAINAATSTWSVSGDWINYDTVTAGASTVVLDGTGILNAGGNAFYNLTAGSASQVTTLTSDLRVTNVLTIADSTGLLTDNGGGYDITVTGTGTPFVNNGATVIANKFVYSNGNPVTVTVAGGTYTVSESLQFDGHNTGAGVTFQLNGDLLVNGAGVIQVYPTTAGVAILDTTASSYNITASNLQVGNSLWQAGFIYANNSIIDIDGNVSFNWSANTTVNLGGSGWFVSGDWTNNSTSFAAGTSTVTFDGFSQQITGTTSFYNLTKVEAADDGNDSTLIFDNAATQTISGALTLTGLDADDRIQLVSDVPGSQWSINLAASAVQALDFVAVTDSDASGSDPGQLTINPTNSINGGNNLGWFGAIAGDDSYNVDEGSTTNLNLSSNDSDPVDGLDLTSIVITSGPSNGSVSVNANGTVDYTHNGSESPSDSFTYTINDNSGNVSNVGTVTINVNPVNDGPTMVFPGVVQFGVEDTPLVFSAANGNPIAVDDADAGSSDLSIKILSYNGGITLNSISGLSFVTGDGVLDTDMEFTGSIADINASLDGLTFTPDADFTGGTNFQVWVNDLGNTGSGFPLQTTRAALINIAPVNDAPTVSATASDTGTEDTDKVYTHAEMLTLIGAGDVDDADTSLNVVINNVTNGAVVLTGGTGGAGTIFTFTPTVNFAGNMTFDYQVSDDEAPMPATSAVGTAAVLINAVNDAPVAVADSFTSNEDGGGFLPPFWGVLTNDTDVDGDPLTAIMVSGISNGSLTLNPNGSYWYWPDADYFGVDSFTYKVNDGTVDSNIVTVTITVNPVNDAPTVLAVSSDSGTEDTDKVYTHAEMLALIGAADVDDVDTNLSVAISNVINGTVAMSGGTGGVGTIFTFTPMADFDGNLTFDYRVSDDEAPTPGTSALGAATINLAAVNDAPVVAAMATDAGFEDMAQVYTHAEMLALIGAVDVDDADADLNVVISNVINGTVAMSGGTGGVGTTFTFTPTSNYVGNLTFEYQVGDDDAPTPATSVVGSATVALGAVNDAPVTSGISNISVDEDTLATFIDLQGSFADIEDPASALVYTITGNTNPGLFSAISLSSSGGLNMNYAPDNNGRTDITVRATDTGGLFVERTFTVTVNPVNDSPTVTNTASETGFEDTPKVYTHAEMLALIGAADVDDAGANLNVAISNVVNGTVTLSNGTGGAGTTFTVTPIANFTGNLTFEYRVSDDEAPTPAISAVGTASITLGALNDAPIHNVPDVQSTTTNSTLIFSSLDGNSITVTDPDGAGPILEVTLTVSNGTISLANSVGLTFIAGSGAGDTAMTFSGTAGAINTALDGMFYQPDSDFKGTARLTIVSDDLGNTGAGGALTAMDVIDITVSNHVLLPAIDELISELLEDSLEDIPDLYVSTPTAVAGSLSAILSEEGLDASGTETDEEGIAAGTDVSEEAVDSIYNPRVNEVTTANNVAVTEVKSLASSSSRPSTSLLVQRAVQMALADPLMAAKAIMPFQPGAPIWGIIDSMMGQMDDDGKPSVLEQDLTVTTTTGVTLTLTAGYVSWLLRAGYISASLLSIAPLWREFDPLPILKSNVSKCGDSSLEKPDAETEQEIDSVFVETGRAGSSGGGSKVSA